MTEMRSYWRHDASIYLLEVVAWPNLMGWSEMMPDLQPVKSYVWTITKKHVKSRGDTKCYHYESYNNTPNSPNKRCLKRWFGHINASKVTRCELKLQHSNIRVRTAAQIKYPRQKKINLLPRKMWSTEQKMVQKTEELPHIRDISP